MTENIQRLIEQWLPINEVSVEAIREGGALAAHPPVNQQTQRSKQFGRLVAPPTRGWTPPEFVTRMRRYNYRIPWVGLRITAGQIPGGE